MATQDNSKQASSVLSQLFEEGNVSADQQQLTQNGLSAFLENIISDGNTGEKISTKLIDQMIANIDKKVSSQIDEVLHNPDFQKLEATWRGLEFLIKRTNFHQNIEINLLHATKDELQSDLEDAPSITESGLYKHVYTAEYGQYGGKPYSALIGDYYFGPGSQDISLLKDLGALGDMAFTPFISAASPQFFNINAWSGLPDLKDLDAVFGMPQYGAWNDFRSTPDSRNVALTLPNFLLRLPYGAESKPVKSFNYNESVTDDSQFLWGNAAYAFASRMTDSFANYGWCANIIGPNGGGKVDNLPLYTYQALGQTETKIPTDILISERREYELAEQGFMSLTVRKNGDDAVFFSANSAQKPKVFPNTPEGKAAELNYRLGTELPYMFIVSRLAHYLKVIQYENIGSWKSAQDIQNQLNEWISQYVVDMNDPGPEVRSQRPLRAAQITVEDIPGDAGWYKCSLTVSPHFKYMGSEITLSLVGKLEKQK
jgi:type VI secretion system protein ImpC